MILHPSIKTAWIDENLTAARGAEVIASFTNLYQTDYSELVVPAPKASFTLDQTNPQHRQLLHLFEGSTTFLPSPVTVNEDEVISYLREPRVVTGDILGWWKSKQEEYPRLSRMAGDFLGIPASSCECERKFSHGKLIIGQQRHGMTDKTIEILEFLKDCMQIS